MRIEEDHFSASHSTSIGEMMSPVINKRSFKMPRAFFFLGRCGANSAIGFPFFVIRTVGPVRASSSFRARFFVLNSASLIVRPPPTLPAVDHGHVHGHIGCQGRMRHSYSVELPASPTNRATTD